MRCRGMGKGPDHKGSNGGTDDRVWGVGGFPREYPPTRCRAKLSSIYAAFGLLSARLSPWAISQSPSLCLSRSFDWLMSLLCRICSARSIRMSLRILLSLWSKKYIVFHSLSSFEGLRVSDEPVGLTHSLGYRARTQLDVEIDIPTR